MDSLFAILAIGFVFIFVMFCLQQGKKKKVGMLGVTLIMIFCTPLLGLFIVEALANKKRPCPWCKNQDNEQDFCSVCNLDEFGNRKPMSGK